MKTEATAVPSPGQRLVSLDAFRGATIAGMILVNNPGSWADAFPQLRHSAWNGWTFTDMIFPFFLWIVGVSMVFSFAKRMEKGDTTGKIILHVVRRSVIIFAIGLFLNGFPFGLLPGGSFSFSTLRIPGVLQRIALCYLIASLVFLKSGVRGQVMWIAGLLTVYWLLVKLVPVPGYGAGIMDPKGGLCWFVDSNLFSGHTWVFAPVPGFDPEGLVSTIPAIATTLFGVLTGHLLRSQRSREEKTIILFVAGNLLLLLGVILDMWLPINKNLWTSSYSVFMAGWASICLAMFYWWIDIRGYTKWTRPFVILGMNAIAAYALSEMLASLLWSIPAGQTETGAVMLQDFLYRAVFAPLASPAISSLLFAVTFVLVMYLCSWIMWKRRWFLKV